MDKFGIFKLLNNFLSNSEQKSSTDTGENNANSINSPDLFSSLIKNLSDKSGASQQQKTDNNINHAKQTPPLQAQMISTINSHEQFVKRVKEKNKH